MAHLILLTRGLAQCRDVWKKYMETQMWPWTRENLKVCQCGRTKEEHDNKDCPCKKFQPRTETTAVQGALRPMELWEYVVPEEHIPHVLANLGLQNYIPRPEIKKFAWLMKKAMNLKELPDCKDLQPNRYMYTAGMAIYPLGVKEDVTQDFDFGGEGSWNQEGL